MTGTWEFDGLIDEASITWSVNTVGVNRSRGIQIKLTSIFVSYYDGAVVDGDGDGAV